MTTLDARQRYNDWVDRVHARAHFRPPGTLGPDDKGCRVVPEAGRCELCAEMKARYTVEIREQAEAIHAKSGHSGAVERCGSPHDVICKAVSW